MIRASLSPPIVMEEVTDPVELAQARKRREQFDRNWAWFKANSTAIYSAHRGKVICIAGQELFAGDTSEQVVAQAKKAHPSDEGRFTYRIPQEKMVRIYANRG